MESTESEDASSGNAVYDTMIYGLFIIEMNFLYSLCSGTITLRNEAWMYNTCWKSCGGEWITDVMQGLESFAGWRLASNIE